MLGRFFVLELHNTCSGFLKVCTCDLSEALSFDALEATGVLSNEATVSIGFRPSSSAYQGN